MTKGYNVFDAIKDAVTGNLELADDDTVHKRRALCDACEVRNAAVDMCTVCGCFLKLKIKLRESTCPMELW